MTRLRRLHPCDPSPHGRGAESSAAGRGASTTLLATGVPPTRTLDPAAVLDLQRFAGNRAVTALLESQRPVQDRSRLRPVPPVPVQREIGWKDASTEGRAWNHKKGQRTVGKIRRLPLEGLPEGMQTKTARRLVQEDKTTGVAAHWVDEPTTVPDLSPEAAVKGRAIVLLHESKVDPKEIEVLVFLHGHTEDRSRPFAGWRELTPKVAKDTRDPVLHKLRQGIDSGDPEPTDVAPVRDVALDRAEQQLEDSGLTNQVIVLPQGGRHSQFAKAGGYDFNADQYVADVVERLVAETVWKEAPKVVRVSMAGHSGAGQTLAAMATESMNRHAGKKKGVSSALNGDLVIFDAINGTNQLTAFTNWALMRLDQDLAVLKDDEGYSKNEKLRYLTTSQKLLGYYDTFSTKPGGYVDMYTQLKKAICGWFDKHAADLGTFAPYLRANFSIVPVALHHEELMRGVPAGEVHAGAGGILDALRALHPPEGKTAADCPVPAAAKPAGTPGPRPSTKKRKRRSKAGSTGASPAPVPGAASPTPALAPAPAPAKLPPTSAAPAGGSRAKQIAKAILLAKTGGQGQGKTEEEKAKSKAAAEAAVAHDIEVGAKMTVDAWFEKFEPDATFLGRRIRPSSPGEPPGVHHELALRLTEAEASLVKPGEKPADAAARLGVKDVSGLRVPKASTGKTAGASMHCFGLAVDIDHDNNPFIGNVDKPTDKRPEGGPSIRITEHATLLLGGEARDPRREPPSLGDHATDSAADREARAARAGQQWKLLSVDSALVQRYLSMSSDELDKVVKDNVAALTSWQELQRAEPVKTGKKEKKKKKHPAPPPWVDHVTDPAWWHAQHEKDIKNSKSGDFGRGDTSDPATFGFMTLHEELVKALVLAGLSWGGAYSGDKDVMHFDLRAGSIHGRPVL